MSLKPLPKEKPTEEGRYWYDSGNGYHAQCEIRLEENSKLRKGKKALVVHTDEGKFLLSSLHGWGWEPVKSLRKHVLPGAAWWFNASRQEQRNGRPNEAIMAMEQSYNQVEGALCEAVRMMRLVAPAGFRKNMTGERWNKFLEQFEGVITGDL